MLNTDLIKQSMRSLGLTGKDLGDACGVSKEAVSNWLSGESIPRPSKLTTLAKTLHVAVEHLFRDDPDEPAAPVIAYRMRANRPPTPEALEAGEEAGRHLRQLLPLMGPLLAPRQLVDPKVDDAYIESVAREIRKHLSLGPTEAVSHERLLELLKEYGALLVPVYWGGDKDGHENAMSVYLPDSKASFVLFNLGCRLDDLSYWLAHELGHVMTLHALRDREGEDFAERLAQTLLFPKELAAQALSDIRSATDPSDRLSWYAGTYGVSKVTVLRSVDKAADAAKLPRTGLDGPSFYAKWKREGKTSRTASDELLGKTRPSAEDIVLAGERIFGTPVFRALARWQEQAGGRSPAFVAAALNLKLGDALELSQAVQAAHV